MAFNGYRIKINGNNFTSPHPSKYRLYPKIIQDLDSDRGADGVLWRNILSHPLQRIELEFPPMTFSQFRAYYSALDSNVLEVEYYDYSSDTYKTATMYHNDIVIEEINTGSGTPHIDRWQFNLIAY